MQQKTERNYYAEMLKLLMEQSFKVKKSELCVLNITVL